MEWRVRLGGNGEKTKRIGDPYVVKLKIEKASGSRWKDFLLFDNK